MTTFLHFPTKDWGGGDFGSTPKWNMLVGKREKKRDFENHTKDLHVSSAHPRRGKSMQILGV